MADAREKEKSEQLPHEQFLQGFKISRAFLRAKQVGEKRGEIQNPVQISQKRHQIIRTQQFLQIGPSNRLFSMVAKRWR